MRTLCDVCESAAAILFCAADEAALCRSCDDKFISTHLVNQRIMLGTEFVNILVEHTKTLGFISLSQKSNLGSQSGHHQNAELVHKCNKLASRHVRVGLADPSDVPRCDICENAPAFFYCEIDGSSLCLQCDMIVHVGGKRTHRRYLVLRQRIEFPGDKPGNMEDPAPQAMDLAEKKSGQNQPPRLTMGENQLNHRVSPAPKSDANADGHAMMDANMIDLNRKPHRTHEQTSNYQVGEEHDLA